MQPTDQALADLARRLTRYETSVSVLKPELMDQYVPLVLLMEDSLKGKNDRGKLLLPELRRDGNSSIGIFSDYGGESSDSQFLTYSLLAFGWNHSYEYQSAITEVRQRHGFSDTTEMSYKGLGRDGRLQRCLPEYLRTADWIAGMLFTLVVDKRIRSLFGPPGKATDTFIGDIVRDGGFGTRKPKVTEKLLRIVHAGAYLTGLVSGPGQNVFWVSDNDAIAPDKETGLMTIRLFQALLPIYSKHEYGKIGWALPSLMEGPTRLMDFLSVADLAAGAVERFMTARERELPVFKSEAEPILYWLGHQGPGLKKHTALIRLTPEKQLQISELVFGSSDPPKDVRVIPMPIKRQ